MRIQFFLFVIILLCQSCSELKQKSINNAFAIKNTRLKDDKFWFRKDDQQDTIPGISLDKWYSINEKKSKNKNIVVAVIDTQLDINHNDFKNRIWTNTKEKPNNGIDDDNNGYVDDINGWSFTGTQNGGYVVWGNFEFVRIIREWDSIYNKKKENQLPQHKHPDFNDYQRALIMFEKQKTDYKNILESQNYSVRTFPIAKDSLKHYFPKENYTMEQLDSMYLKYKINDKTFRQRRLDNDLDLGAMIGFLKRRIELDEKTIEDVIDSKVQYDSIVNKNLNLNYDERKLIGDNPNRLEKGYGNNLISNNKKGYRNIQNHSTKVSGIIVASTKSIRLMPLCISFSGDEHDKDIAMAIYYAVDNGAKVINMSFGKEFSMHKKWVLDALKYAEEKNVLIVHAAGNDQFDIDSNPFFPNDVDYENPNEVVENFINVGATTSKADSTLVASFSNYGKKNVDLFAPGEKIYTTTAGNSYGYDSGTSLAAPMVSGTAALIWSYYPKLTAKQVKEIILESGTAYDMEVLVPGGQGKKAKFSELSKSGKVLNVYNAMQLAEKVSKKKR